MNQTQMTLLEKWDGRGVDGWLASEKYDGCRAYWDGEKLWTRSGEVIEAPSWFTKHLPRGIHLDGELWAGRGRFEEARLATQYGRFTRNILFVVFDAPKAKGTWPQRLKLAQRNLARSGAQLAFTVDWTTVESTSDLLSMLRRTKKRGGEGLVIRNPYAAGYETGRTQNALKVKTY